MRTATRRFQNSFAFVTASFESDTSTAADGAELSTSTCGHRSRRTPGRRGGQLVLAGQNDRKPPTNSPEEPNFLSSIFALTGTSMPAAAMLTDQEAAYRGRQELAGTGFSLGRPQVDPGSSNPCVESRLRGSMSYLQCTGRSVR